MPAATRTATAMQALIALGCRRAGVSEIEANEAAKQAIELLVAEYGGRRVYIPQHEVARRARYEAIARNIAAGASIARLARKYGVSRRRIRQIAAAWHAFEAARTQQAPDVGQNAAPPPA